MIIAGIAMMRDEADVCVQVTRHMLAECDLVIVADNRSSDGTWDVLAEIGDAHFGLVEDPQEGFYQSAAMMRLVAIAVEHGAAWIVPFDADEWWFAPDGRRIADVLAATDSDVVPVGSWEMVPQHRDDLTKSDPFRRITHRRVGANIQKIAFRPGPGRVLEMGNHVLVQPGASPGQLGWSSALLGLPSTTGQPLAVYHYPYRSFEQLRRKVRAGRMALEATDYSPGVGAHWRELGAMDDATLRRWWDNWTSPLGLVQT